MRTSRNKISTKQFFYVFTVMVSSPATRFLSKDAATKAAQAGWVSPLFSLLPAFILLFVLDSLVKQYKGKSMHDIINSLMGKYLGWLINFVCLLWMIWNTALYTRYYSERMTSTLYPHMTNSVFAVLLLILIAYIMRSGFTVIARMCELLLPFIGAMLVMLSSFLLPKVRLDNVFPVYFNDTIPMIKASLAPTAFFTFMFVLSFIHDKVVNLKYYKNFGRMAVFVNSFSMALLIFITIGILGSSVSQRTSMPVLITVKQISLMDTIENIEAIVVAIWIFADFILISSFFNISLAQLRAMFKLSDTKPLINIYALLIYFLSLGACSDKFELEKLSGLVMLPTSIVICYGTPILLFILSKLKDWRRSKKAANPSQ